MNEHDDRTPDDTGPQAPAQETFTIYESDLADLEHTLPDLLSASYATLTHRQRVQWRLVQQIITNVRWNYGPPSEVIVVDA